MWVNPAMNSIRSSEAFVRRVEASTASVPELGCVACREENLLMSHRVTVNFGHARWSDWEQEADDAAAWFAEKPGRVLLVNERVQQRCFANSTLQPLQDGNRDPWFLVSAGVDADCVSVAMHPQHCGIPPGWPVCPIMAILSTLVMIVVDQASCAYAKQ
jgi:hypothetical protein